MSGCRVPARISRILLIQRPQIQFVANWRTNLRFTTCYSFTVVAWTQSHDQRRWRDRTQEHSTQQGPKKPLATRIRITTSGLSACRQRHYLTRHFHNYPSVSSDESLTDQFQSTSPPNTCLTQQPSPVGLLVHVLDIPSTTDSSQLLPRYNGYVVIAILFVPGGHPPHYTFVVLMASQNCWQVSIVLQ